MTPAFKLRASVRAHALRRFRTGEVTAAITTAKSIK